ncbi:MAG TPA: hypothetical protein VM578_04100 [Candidatus Saccharimonadales bacterium]|nr:hypothetical protein [Candidatus Saccharimonadales bacterium]
MEDERGHEKRMIQRFALELPVDVTAHAGEEVHATATTRDVISHGICFYCDAAIERESIIEFTLTLPTEITMAQPMNVRCRGTVVRREDGSPDGHKFTIAAAIESYEFVSDDGLQK